MYLSQVVSEALVISSILCFPSGSQHLVCVKIYLKTKSYFTRLTILLYNYYHNFLSSLILPNLGHWDGILEISDAAWGIHIVYGDDEVNDSTARTRFVKFKKGFYYLREKHSSGQPLELDWKGHREMLKNSKTIQYCPVSELHALSFFNWWSEVSSLPLFVSVRYITTFWRWR